MKNRRNYYLTKLLLRFLFLLVFLPAFGQDGNLLKNNSFNESRNINISSVVDGQKEYIRSMYFEKIAAPKELINGKEYVPYYTRSKFKPLLFYSKGRTASIITNTRRYDNLTLQYDTFLDEVIYTDTSRTINFMFPLISLNKDIIDGFNLYFEDDSLIFRFFRLPECSEKNLKEGFYEVVYEGRSKYIIKHESFIYERDGLHEYKYSPLNYICVGDKYYKFKTRRNLLRLFGEKSGEIKEYLHLYRLRVRQANKNQIVSILKFYDSFLTSDRRSE